MFGLSKTPCYKNAKQHSFVLRVRRVSKGLYDLLLNAGVAHRIKVILAIARG